MTYVQASLHGTYIYMHKYNMAHIKMTTYMTHLRTTLHTYIHTLSCFYSTKQSIYSTYLPTFRFLADHSFQGVESVGNHPRPPLQGVDEGVLLGAVLVIGEVSLLRRVHHQTQCDLTWHVGAQVDGGHLVQLVHHGGVHVVQLHVASSQTALPVRTLTQTHKTKQIIPPS